MPPDSRGLVLKFIPNHPKLAEKVYRVLSNVFRARFLPQELVKLIVRRAFEMEREQDMEIESTVFEEKLTSYAHQLRPRFMKQIVHGNRKTTKW